MIVFKFNSIRVRKVVNIPRMLENIKGSSDKIKGFNLYDLPFFLKIIISLFGLLIVSWLYDLIKPINNIFGSILLYFVIPLLVSYLLFFYPFNKKISFDNLPLLFVSYFISYFLISLNFLSFIKSFFVVLTSFILFTQYGLAGLFINIIFLFVLFDFILSFVLFGESLIGLFSSFPLFLKKKKPILKILENLEKTIKKDLEKIEKDVSKLEKHSRQFNEETDTIINFLLKVFSTIVDKAGISSFSGINNLISKFESVKNEIRKCVSQVSKQINKEENNNEEDIQKLIKLEELVDKWIEIIRNLYIVTKKLNNLSSSNLNNNLSKELIQQIIQTFSLFEELTYFFNRNKEKLKEDEIKKIFSSFNSFSQSYNTTLNTITLLLHLTEDIYRKRRVIHRVERFTLKDYKQLCNDYKLLRKNIERLNKKLNNFIKELKNREKESNWLSFDEKEKLVEIIEEIISWKEHYLFKIEEKIKEAEENLFNKELINEIKKGLEYSKEIAKDVENKAEEIKIKEEKMNQEQIESNLSEQVQEGKKNEKKVNNEITKQIENIRKVIRELIDNIEQINNTVQNENKILIKTDFEDVKKALVNSLLEYKEENVLSVVFVNESLGKEEFETLRRLCEIKRVPLIFIPLTKDEMGGIKVFSIGPVFKNNPYFPMLNKKIEKVIGILYH